MDIKNGHDLYGLNSGSPIGFLAALGMLRVLVSDCGLDVRIGWRNGHAVINGIDPDTAIEYLFANMADRDRSPEFNWADSLRKVSPEVYRTACLKMAGDHRALGFMAGWATDAVFRDDFIMVTHLDMTSGHKKLLKDLRVLASRVNKIHLRAALLGGGYEDQHSFGLDPIAVRSHAHESQAPTKTKAPGKPGLLWLAFESIPLHPVFPVAANRRQTVGWRVVPNVAYVWPLWDRLLSLEEVFLLRTLPVELLDKRPGVSEVWASNYDQTGKYGMLLPARRER